MLKQQIKNKRLLIVLGVLLVLIIGLIVGIIIANVNSNNHGQESEESTSTGNESNNENGMTEEEIALSMHFIELRESIEADVAAINALYDNGIAECLNKNELDFAVSFIYSRTYFFIGKNFKQEALDALLSMDWDMLNGILTGAELYRQYTMVIDLADELGDTATSNKFKQLRLGVEEAHQADINVGGEVSDDTNDMEGGE